MIVDIRKARRKPRPPVRRMTVAADGATELRVARFEDGHVTLRLSSGGLAIVVILAASDVEFLFGGTEQGQAA